MIDVLRRRMLYCPQVKWRNHGSKMMGMDGWRFELCWFRNCGELL